MAIALYISRPPVTLFFHFVPANGPSLEIVTIAHSLLCCIAFARGHRKTTENLCRYRQPFNRVCSKSTVSEKMTPRSAFRCIGRGPAVTHLSTEPAPSCLTSVIVWHRTPTTHRTMSVLIFYENILNREFKEIARYVVDILHN